MSNAPTFQHLRHQINGLKLSVSGVTNVLDGEKVDLYIRWPLPATGRPNSEPPIVVWLQGTSAAITTQGVQNYMTKKLCLLAALILSLSSVGCVEKVKARMEIKAANEAYEKENYSEALVHYQNARKIDSTFPDLDRLIGYSEIGL
ncbi:MAG TPA: hypothetical protein VN605_03010, partial [Thermoanaerobaculia bacterium]|nr:hypothetical protein [Thermoanaerobaculia bacterium]